MVDNASDNDEHPLAAELNSLKASVLRFQDEAHSAAVKLQRYSLDTSNAHDRLVQLEKENALLRNELEVLRTNPGAGSSQDGGETANVQTQEFTLTLRKLSDKLSLTEEALLQRNTELVHAHSEATRAKLAEDRAYALAARSRGNEEQGKLREVDLERQVWEAREQTKLSDLVVQEYASLVRSLEGRGPKSPDSTSSIPSATASTSTVTLVDGLLEGKSGLQKLFNDFSSENDRLLAEVAQLQSELTMVEAKNEAEKKAAELDRSQRATIQTEIDKLTIDDNTAAKMVSRYMKFSQTSTNALQGSLETMKARQRATVDTLTTQIESLSNQLRTSQMATEKLRDTLDELGKDVMRETFGRRREVALRIRLLTREEAFQEELRRLVSRAQNSLDRSEDVDTLKLVLQKVVDDAYNILTRLDHPGLESSSPEPISGSLARLVSTQSAVAMLTEELHNITTRNVELERVCAVNSEGVQPVHIATDKSVKSKKKLPEVPSNPELNHATPQRSPTPPNSLLADGKGLVDGTAVIRTEHGEIVSPELVDVIFESSPHPSPHPPSQISDQPRTTSSESPEEEAFTPAHEPEQFAFPTQEAEETDRNESVSPMPVTITPTATATATPIPAISVSFRSDPLAPQSPSPVVETPGIPTHVPPPLDILQTLGITEPLQTPQHPLLAELRAVARRYDDIQKSFKDCHLALQDLKKNIGDATPAGTQGLFSMALERLSDFTEDARVELEIRIADEALLARGFETLLAIPAAMAGGIVDPRKAPTIDEDQIAAFVSGSDPNVQRAEQSLRRKLEDVEHDIAALKRAIFEMDTPPVTPEVVSPLSPSGNGNGNGNVAAVGNNGGWSSWIRGGRGGGNGSPSSSPIQPTFGDVMTSPKLRHVRSMHLHLRNGSTESIPDPFAHMGLRVAMPRAQRAVPTVESRGIRPRTLSTMYMLGIGARRSNSAISRSVSTGSGDVDQEDVE